MKRSLTILRIRGVPIQIHWTFPLLFLLFGGLLYLIQAPAAAYVYMALAVIIIFVFVLLHELAHVMTARVFGVRTRSITLFPLGGLSALERVPERPGQEALVALAGPLLNLVAAFLLIPAVIHFHGVQAIFAFRFLDLTETSWGESAAEWLLSIFWINVILGAFNLIPAIPLDGGRVMRASLAMRLPYASATRFAALVGRMFAIAFVIIGLFYSLILALIGIFVFFGASTEERAAQLMRLFSRFKAHEAMRSVPQVPPEATHDALVALRDPARPTYLAVVANGTLAGVIPPDALRFLQPRDDRTAADIMTHVPRVDAETDLGEVLRHFAGGNADAVGVHTVATPEEPSRYAGLITTEDMESAYRHLERQEREARESRRQRRAARRMGGDDVPVAVAARPLRDEPDEDVERWVPMRRER